jgi:antitoxin YefM
MQVVTLKEAQSNLKSIFDSVCFDSEETIIHGENGQNVVLIPFEEYNSIKETNYLFSSKTNKERILSSLKNLKNGDGVEKELIE